MSVFRESLNRITWRDFLGFAGPHGVTLESTDQPLHVGDSAQKGQYLLRRLGDEQLWFPMPSNFDLDDRIGMFRWENLCRRLKLDGNFTGWPYIL